jgi:hypothetical protein
MMWARVWRVSMWLRRDHKGRRCGAGVVDDLGGVAGENDAGGVRSWLVGGRVRQAFGSGAATPCQGSVGVASCYLLRSVALFARCVNGYTVT